MEERILVVAIPSALMLLGSLVAFFGRVPELIQAAMQNFSAGLLIAAVAGELFPLMTGKVRPVGAADTKPPNTMMSIVAIAIGFSLALLFMFGLEKLTENDEDAEDNCEREASDLMPLAQHDFGGSGKDSAAVLGAVSEQIGQMRSALANLQKALLAADRDTIDEQVHALTLPTHALQRTLVGIPSIVENLADLELSNITQNVPGILKGERGIVGCVHGQAERGGTFARWRSVRALTLGVGCGAQIPWPLVFTVVIDAGVDGLLIGLAFAADPGAGWSMSIATTIEMCFLGLSFSAAIQNATRSRGRHAGTVALPPLTLFVTGALGSMIGKLLTSWVLVFITFIAFAVVALLFLVSQELLTKAREVAGENKLINVMFFVGVFCGILLGTFFG